MGEKFKNPLWVTSLGWICAIALTVLNIRLIIETMSGIFKKRKSRTIAVFSADVRLFFLLALAFGF